MCCKQSERNKAMKNPYETLGVSKDASADEIKSAYRRLAKKYHPDLNPNDPTAAEKLKEVNEAFSVLSDDQKRKNYDQFGSADGPTGFGFGGFDFSGGFGDLGDIFGQMFGFGGGRRGTNQANAPQRGADIEMRVNLTFEEAAFGTSKVLSVTSNKQCKTCNGTGAKDGTAFETCSACHGTGRVTSVQNTMFGRVQTESTCGACHGTGKIIKEKCPDCNGKGYNRTTTNVEVEIPGGVDNGEVLRVSGKGEAGKNGGKTGDLIIVVSVSPHKTLKRKGSNLFAEIEVPLKDALLGCQKEIDGVGEKLTITIPECTQPGTTQILRGKGTKSLGRMTRGDLYVTINVKLPKKLDKKQRKALEDLEL